MATIAERLRYAISIRGIKQVELAQNTGICSSSISTYLKGIYEPKQQNLDRLSKALGVQAGWLMGGDVPMELDEDVKQKLPSNIIPFPETEKKPLLGRIACGTPILAQENIEDLVEVPLSFHCDFVLQCQGDSMSGARILDGDLVCIRRQDEVDNGEIAAVLIGEEATLKRVYYNRDRQYLSLSAENSAYEPLIYAGAELDEIRIIGKAVGFISRIV